MDKTLPEAQIHPGKLTRGGTIGKRGADGTREMVQVASWGAAHEEQIVAAIGAGKPVFCEKPLAPASDACLRIIDAELASGRRAVQVGFMRRYDASYLAMKATLDDGGAGTPLLMHENPAGDPAGSRAGDRVPADWRERFIRAYDAELQDWLDAVAAGTCTGPSAWDGYAAAAVTDSALQALRTGQRIPVSLAERPDLYAKP